MDLAAVARIAASEELRKASRDDWELSGIEFESLSLRVGGGLRV